MSRLDIKIYPHPVLRKKAEPVTEIDEELRNLANDMIETMYDAGGIGLAAPQVGISKRLIVADIGRSDERKHKAIIMFNPEITSSGGEYEFEEGCLSLPGLSVRMKRAAEITVRYMDEAGATKESIVKETSAVVIQHEIDHLNGVLLIDELSELQKDMYLKKLRRACRQG